LPVHDLIDRIYYEGDVIDRFRRSTPALLQGRVTANLQQVLDMALQVDSGRYPSLMRFLDRLKRIRRSADEAPDNPPDPGPSAKVRLMTIHAAKGLEAPVVFLADTAASVKRNDSYRALVDWPAARPRPEQFVLYTRADACPEPIAGLRETVHRMQTAEDANLLYVALTRARHMVLVSAAGNKNRALEKGWYALLKQGFERLTGSRDDGGDRIGAVPAPDPHQPAPEPDDTGADEAPPPFDGGPPPAGGAEAGDAARPPAVTDDPEARQYGIVVHHMLERLSPPGAVSGADAQRHLPEPVGDPMLAACRHEAEAVLGEPRFAFLFEPARYRVAYKEVPIACSGAGGDLQYGIVDRLVVTGDAVWVIDYKTRRPPDGAGGDAALERDREQLNRYAAAVARLWPDQPIRRGVLFTRDRKLVEL
jgi:ATP-dependent helicase/nuclease subunit A